METGAKKTFALNLEDVGVSRDVDFIFVKGIGYVADMNVCGGKSYNKLNECGYVEGKKMTLDGVDYLCRILTMGEWDDIMDWDDSNDVWHWDDEYSWVRSAELERADSSYRAIRGSNSAVYWSYSYASLSSSNIGFRPALVPLTSDALQSDGTAGQTANALTLDEIVNGIIEHKDELERANSSSRALRGSHSAVSWGNSYASTSITGLGFRPALVPLTSDALQSDGTAGQTANALTLDEIVNGIIEHKDELATPIRLTGALSAAGLRWRR